MEASAAEASGQSERTGSRTQSDRRQDGPTKPSLKRAANMKTKKKKKKRPRLSTTNPLGYTVHQGEDMLFLISSSASHSGDSVWIPNTKRSKKKKVVKGKLKARAKPKRKIQPVIKEEKDTNTIVPKKDPRWGQSLPEEVLINIFKMVVVQDGAVPFLCRVGRVCRLWNAAASSPVLWRKVTIGHCWIAPGKSQLPKTEKKITDTLNWLAQNRFSQLRDFSLCHWKKNVDYALEVVSQFSPHLGSIKLSFCSGLTTKAFQSLGQHSRSLNSINLQESEFQVEGFLEYLENHGSQMKQLLFTRGVKNNRILTTVSKGHCPDLELLEVNNKLDSKQCELPLCLQALQRACPKLKTFRMLNVTPMHKTKSNAADSTPGFPLLEELCIASTSYSYMTDKDLWDILFDSTRLRVLDLRGCSRITPSGLAALPCTELECLFWAQYFSSHVGMPSLKTGLHMVTQKWSRTLQQLDIANQVFSEEDMEMAMSCLAQAAEADMLRSLNLSGTRITPRALRPVIEQMTALDYLNLSSCRYLPRGMKTIYRGQKEIRQLLDKLE
ncbi:F-box/LRR-repeat protein 6 [Mugil cephalus]|uniref:F-box/LRR-repeat protein 6 n=1 Tax=Mugil cephalus TaxID=48193 RepID=UPI001FB5CB1E|nr:F-box/LRR-repeat protein 6 [Mugil cephalus]